VSRSWSPSSRCPLPLLALGLLLPAVLLVGCPSSDDDACLIGAEGCTCTSQGACDPGLTCASNRCVRLGGGGTGGAGGAGGAPSGNTGGSGNPTGTGGSGNPPPAGTEVGAACTAPAACASGACLAAPRFPGGYCSQACGAELDPQGTSCPGGSTCVQVSEASATCLDLCGGADGACRSGYTCTPAGDKSVCYPRCTGDADCGPDTGCNQASGLCEAGMVQVRRAGASCAAPEQCMSSSCITQEASMGVFPGGFCRRLCTAADEDKPCPDGDGICLGLPTSMGTKAFICFPSCSTGVGCRRDYTCSLQVNVQTAGGLGVCVPRCDRFTCRTGFTCDATVGLCVRNAAPGDTNTVERRELGTVNVGPLPPTTPTASVQVPEGAASFALVSTPADRRIQLEPVRVVAPNGRAVFNGGDPFRNEFRTIAFFPGVYPMLFPNAPRLNLIPGTYQIFLRSSAATPVKLDLLIKRQAGVLQGGSLPLVLWFTKQKHLNAQTAPTDARLQEALRFVTEVYQAIGVKIGPITYLDLQGAQAEAFSVIGAAQAAELFALANNSNELGLHYFMIDHFNLQGGGTLLGLSGGAPGPPAFPGLPRGGVAVALGYPELGAAILGQTMAHEGGHYLGLFHASESNGLSFDPLLDTPECSISNDRDQSRTVDPEECEGKGADNLMFWTPGRVARRLLTNDQRFVVLRNPALQ
jgi:hypothetical protein